jgi:hypothetical protein
MSVINQRERAPRTIYEKNLARIINLCSSIDHRPDVEFRYFMKYHSNAMLFPAIWRNHPVISSKWSLDHVKVVWHSRPEQFRAWLRKKLNLDPVTVGA